MPRRIAQVPPLWLPVPPLNYGGTELAVHLLTEELVDRGHEVTLFASADSRTRANLVPVLPYSLLERMSRGLAYEHQHYVNAAVAAILQRRDCFDIVHFHLGCEYIPLGTL